MAKTFTQRTLLRLRKLGLTAAVVERWNQNVHRGDGGFGVRQDLFGWIDVIALEPGKGILGIQSTSMGQKSAHKRKLAAQSREKLALWCASGGRAELWCWKQVRGLWEVECIDLDPLEGFLGEAIDNLESMD